MVQGKAPLSIPVRESFLKELEGAAAGERRKLSEMTELILEWSTEQLLKAGSLNQLLRCRIHLPDGLSHEHRATSGRVLRH